MRSLIYITVAFLLLLVVGYDSVAFILGDLHWVNRVWEWSPADRFSVVLAILFLATVSWFVGASL